MIGQSPRRRTWFATLTAVGTLALLSSSAFAVPDASHSPLTMLERIAFADRLARGGRLGQAFAGYLVVLKDYPTWWLPMLKAGVTARAMRMPPDTVRELVSRAMGLSPEGPYAGLIAMLLGLEAGQPPPALPGDHALPGVENLPGDKRDLIRDRQDFARALQAERSDSRVEAKALYRELIQRRPTFVAARVRLARMLFADGASDEARGLLMNTRATSLLPARIQAMSRR